MDNTGLSQWIRDNLNEITKWRSEGMSWSEVEERSAVMGFNPGMRSVQNLYYRELVRRRSPKRMVALRWAKKHYESIKDLLTEGYEWADLPVLLPLKLGSTPAPTLNMLIAEFKTIDKARTTAQLDHSAAQTDPHTTQALTTIEPHVLPRATEPRSELADPVPDMKAPPETEKSPNRNTEAPEPWPGPLPPRIIRSERKPKSAADSSPPPAHSALPKEASSEPDEVLSEPEDPAPEPAQTPAKAVEDMTTEERIDAYLDSPPPKRRNSGLQKILAEAKAKKDQEAEEKARAEAARYHHPYHEPVCNPYIPVEEYQNKMSLILARRDALLPSLHAATGEEEVALQYQVNEIHGELQNVKDDFFTRFSHRQATKSALCILSSAALACEVFKIVDESAPNAIQPTAVQPIKLQGYDRPDHMQGPDGPDPLYIIENFTHDELARIVEAYATDQSEFHEFNHADATPLRRLTEALVVRGAFQYRISGWVDYDAYVKLSSVDFPSPTLTQAQIPYQRATSHNHAPVAEFAPKLTGDEPDRDSLKRWQREDLINTRGMWLGHAI